MSVTSEATTLWFGDLISGSGTTSLDSSDAAEFPVTWAARSEGEAGRTNPEELLGAAHSACYSMAFSNALAKNGACSRSELRERDRLRLGEKNRSRHRKSCNNGRRKTPAL